MIGSPSYSKGGCRFESFGIWIIWCDPIQLLTRQIRTPLECMDFFVSCVFFFTVKKPNSSSYTISMEFHIGLECCNRNALVPLSSTSQMSKHKEQHRGNQLWHVWLVTKICPRLIFGKLWLLKKCGDWNRSHTCSKLWYKNGLWHVGMGGYTGYFWYSQEYLTFLCTKYI